MKIQVLGTGCPTCKSLHKAVEEVVKKLNLDAPVEYSTDIVEITKLGAMGSPVFAIDGKIISVGKVPTNEEIETALTGKSSKKSSQKCCSGKNPEKKPEKSSCCSKKTPTPKKLECCSGGSCETEKKSKCCIVNLIHRVKKFFS